MNIVILGGGTPGKFGNDFAVKARSEGHRVIIFSHKSNYTNDQDQHIIDYDNTTQSQIIFSNVLENIDKVDILILNQNGSSYPYVNRQHNFNQVDIEQYHHSLNVHVIMSHLLIAACHKKMDTGSKVTYMSTGLAFQFVRDTYHEHYGYGAYKSFMTHLMMGFANNRTKEITYTVFSPHFPYEDRERYNLVFDNCYKWIFDHSDNVNGCVIGGWEPSHSPYKIFWQMYDERSARGSHPNININPIPSKARS